MLGAAASMVMQIEDVARKILYQSSASAVIRIAGTCRANFALAREEALWEHLFVRSGMRFRPPGWATASSAGYEDELMPDSWRLAFRDCLKLAIPASRGRRLQISSGGLTILQALELATVGDVLELAPGFYPPIIVSKAVTIVGLNRDCAEIEGVKVEADGVTIASLTILGKHLDSTSHSLVNLKEESSAVTVSAKNVRIIDCSIRGDQGIDVREGICQVLSCDIHVRDCCFRGSGELTCCRLEDQSQHPQSHNHHARGEGSVVLFHHGNNAVTNCLVDGSNIGVRVDQGGSCHVTDSVITANAYGISVQGSQNSPSSSRLLLQNSRVHSCSEAGVRMEAAGTDVELFETEFALNAVGVLAEGWFYPHARGCHLTDRGPRRSSLSGVCCRGAQVGGAGSASTKSSRRQAELRKNRHAQGDTKGGDTKGGDTKGCVAWERTRLALEGCNFDGNQRSVEVVTTDNISFKWTVPFA